jgi:hypothetical protein
VPERAGDCGRPQRQTSSMSTIFEGGSDIKCVYLANRAGRNQVPLHVGQTRGWRPGDLMARTGHCRPKGRIQRGIYSPSRVEESWEYHMRSELLEHKNRRVQSPT